MTHEEFAAIVKQYEDACDALQEKAKQYGSALFEGRSCSVDEIGVEMVTVSRYSCGDTDYESFPTAWLFSDVTPEQRRSAIAEQRKAAAEATAKRRQEEAAKQERAVYEKLREKYEPARPSPTEGADDPR